MNLFLEQSKIQAVPYNMADDILSSLMSYIRNNDETKRLSLFLSFILHSSHRACPVAVEVLVQVGELVAYHEEDADAACLVRALVSTGARDATAAAVLLTRSLLLPGCL